MNGTVVETPDTVPPLRAPPTTGIVDAYDSEASTGVAGVRSKKKAPNPTSGTHTHIVIIRPQPNQVAVLTR